MMKFIVILILLLFACESDSKKNHQGLVAEINKDSIFHNIKTFADFGIKNNGSQGNTNTRQWIQQKAIALGYSVSIDSFMFSNRTGHNIIVDVPGTLDENRYIMITGHYDSVTSGPGTDDNGSGVSIMLEILRVIKDQQFEKNLKFVFFDAEELGLQGSEYYADVFYDEGNQLDFLFNLDMVGGYKQMSHWKIVCEEDQNGHSASDALSHALNIELVDAFKKYSTLEPVIGPAYATDYVPFERKGYTIIGLFEYRGDVDNPNYHKSTDTYENIHKTYAFQVALGAMGFLDSKLNLDQVD